MKADRVRPGKEEGEGGGSDVGWGELRTRILCDSVLWNEGGKNVMKETRPI